MQARGTFQPADRFDGHDTRDCVLTGAIEGLEEVDRGADVLDRSLSIGSIDHRVDRGGGLARRCFEESEAGPAFDFGSRRQNVPQRGRGSS